jgi:hypothetical protein
MDERAVELSVLSFALSLQNLPLPNLLCKTDAKQDDAGREQLRDRMNPDDSQ